MVHFGADLALPGAQIIDEKCGLGPAAGFVAQNKWGLIGPLNQNILTVGGDDTRPGVNLSTLQPILLVPLGKGWSIGTSDITFA